MNNTMLLFILHIVFCVIYFIYWCRKDKEDSFYRLTVVFFMPFAGFLYFVFTDLFSKKEGDSIEKLGTLHGIERDVARVGYLRVDYQKEVNVVPIEEALILNSGAVKRKLIVDTLKDDIDRYIAFLNNALSDEDTETSHYAAATVMEIRRRLTLAMQELEVKYEKDKKDLETALAYADILKKYLRSGFLDNKNYVKYKYIYSNVLENILSMQTDDEVIFVEKINCDLELGEYVKANEYCHLFHKLYADSEKPYLMHMKLFYIMGDYKKMNRALSLLKSSDIKFTNEALNTVRFWSEVRT